jgi:hypothetical protein
LTCLNCLVYFRAIALRLACPAAIAPVDLLDEEGEPPKMTRSILIVIAVGVFLAIVAGSGCAPAGIGDPCIPEQEYDQCFPGFSEGEVNTESRSFQCQTRLCLVNHFQGRVSCPYGQTAAGTNPILASANCPAGTTGGGPFAACTPMGGIPGFQLSDNSSPPCTSAAQPCSIPGGATVLGGSGVLEAEYAIQVDVPPQLTPRQTANAVYCSCRCENAQGQTNDGEVYCQCPTGFTCEQLVFPTTSTAGSTNLTGGYCIKVKTEYNSLNAGAEATCNPASNPCPSP